MIDSYSISNTNIKVNAVSGTLVKNYQKSFFTRFQIDSPYSKSLLCDNAKIADKKAVVIQCMCAGGKNGNEIIAEVMWKEDFDKMFED
jgi:hypothetical protein